MYEKLGQILSGEIFNISYEEKFLHVTEFPHIYHVEKFSRWQFLHMTNFFSTDAVCGVCDKYEVCL